MCTSLSTGNAINAYIIIPFRILNVYYGHLLQAVTEESKLQKAEEVLKKFEENLKELLDTESFAGSKDEETNAKIQYA